MGILVVRTVHATLTDSQASRAYLNNRAAPILRTSSIMSAVLVMCIADDHEHNSRGDDREVVDPCSSIEMAGSPFLHPGTDVQWGTSRAAIRKISRKINVPKFEQRTVTILVSYYLLSRSGTLVAHRSLVF